VLNPQPTSAATALGGSGTAAVALRTNALAAGLPPNFFVMNPDASSTNISRPVGGSKYHTLQVEISRHLYMNEATMAKTANFGAVRQIMERLVVALISLATAGHQGWSANLYTTVSDAFPKSAVASVTGIGGFLGGIGGVIFASLVPGFVVPAFGYLPVFVLMGTLHLIALACVYFFIGRASAPVPATR